MLAFATTNFAEDDIRNISKQFRVMTLMKILLTVLSMNVVFNRIPVQKKKQLRKLEAKGKALLRAEAAVVFNPRSAGGLSHLRTAGGADTASPPQRTRKQRKIAPSGKRCSIGCGTFYKKYSDHFFIRSNLRSYGVKKGQIFSKSRYFHSKSQLSQ